MRAVFIRHKLSTTNGILEDLWSRRKIAVHYQNIRSANPNDYEQPGKNALKRLWRYCVTGAIVGASFRSIRPTQMIVGLFEKGSQVEWTDKYGDEFIYKTVQLRDSRIVSYRDYPLLAAIRPRLVTVTGWPSAQKYLEAILGKRQIPPDVKSLDPSQLEVICHEFLRVNRLIAALLMPIGRALPDIDIYGIDETGNNVIAQVTHSIDHSKIEDKMKRLREYQSPDTFLIFFGPESCRLDDPAVRYIAIEEVFDALSTNKDNATYKRLIARMLKWEEAA